MQCYHMCVSQVCVLYMYTIVQYYHRWVSQVCVYMYTIVQYYHRWVWQVCVYMYKIEQFYHRLVSQVRVYVYNSTILPQVRITCVCICIQQYNITTGAYHRCVYMYTTVQYYHRCVSQVCVYKIAQCYHMYCHRESHGRVYIICTMYYKSDSWLTQLSMTPLYSRKLPTNKQE